MCVALDLGAVGGTDTFGLTLPKGWIVESAARWPSSIAACATAATLSWPPERDRAASGTGTVTLNGRYGAAGFTADVDVVLNFPQGDSGASESETLQAKAIPAAGACN
jgi:hypothetical protein